MGKGDGEEGLRGAGGLCGPLFIVLRGLGALATTSAQELSKFSSYSSILHYQLLHRNVCAGSNLLGRAHCSSAAQRTRNNYNTWANTFHIEHKIDNHFVLLNAHFAILCFAPQPPSN